MVLAMQIVVWPGPHRSVSIALVRARAVFVRSHAGWPRRGPFWGPWQTAAMIGVRRHRRQDDIYIIAGTWYEVPGTYVIFSYILIRVYRMLHFIILTFYTGSFNFSHFNYIFYIFHFFLLFFLLLLHYFFLSFLLLLKIDHRFFSSISSSTCNSNFRFHNFIVLLNLFECSIELIQFFLCFKNTF